MKKRVIYILLFLITGLDLACAQHLQLEDCFLDFNRRPTRTIVEDNYGFIWFMRSDGYFRFDGKEIEFIDPTIDSERPIYHSGGTILPLENGDYWFASRDASVIIYRAKEDWFLRKVFFPIEDTTIQVYGRDVLVTGDSVSRQFFSGDNGIWEVDQQLNPINHIQPALVYGSPNIGPRKTNEVRRLVYDPKRNSMWVGGMGGLFQYHLGKDSLVFHPLDFRVVENGLRERASFLVNDIKLDGDVIKMATWGGGLMMLDISTDSITSYGFEKDKIPYRRRGNTQVAETTAGRIFLAHEMVEMGSWAPGEPYLTPVNVDNQVSRRGIGAMVDRLGYLWVGHWANVCRYRVDGEPPVEKTAQIYINDIRLDSLHIRQRMNRWDNQKLEIKDRFSTLEFTYRAINPLSYDNIRYEYRLNGADTDWQQSGAGETAIYPILKNGSYIFQARYFDEISQTYIYSGSVEIIVDVTIWLEAYLVKGLLALLGMGLLGFLIFRYRIIQRQKQAQQTFETQLREVQDAALRSQMNPHFLFNCLNSIRYFIVTNDNKKAADYLTKFSRLIRMILEHSKKKLVSLDSELQLLELYIKMEMIRFENKFDFEVEMSSTVKAAKVMIPPMIMQPYIENAILHGINPKDSRGKIMLSIKKQAPYLAIEIEDDGIGRIQSKALKDQSVLKKKSLGMNITKARLDLADTASHKADIKIVDKYNEQGDASGTKVIIRLPVY
ncbi:MAG: histidine kinase [Bacteroidota bacterium]